MAIVLTVSILTSFLIWMTNNYYQQASVARVSEKNKKPEHTLSGKRNYPWGKATATLKGKASFVGQTPIRIKISTEMDSKLFAIIKDHPLYTESALVDETGGLANVLVHISKGMEPYEFQAPQSPFVLIQQYGRYEPHVFGVMVGQKLTILNKDSTPHNPHLLAVTNERFSRSQRTSLPFEEIFEEPELPFPIKCDIHPWMISHCGVFSHPFYAVSSENGSFTIKELLPGNYQLSAWHEKFRCKVSVIDIVLSDKQTLNVEFNFEAKK